MVGGVTFGNQRLSRRFSTRVDPNHARLRLGEVLDYPFFWYARGGRVNP